MVLLLDEFSAFTEATTTQKEPPNEGISLKKNMHVPFFSGSLVEKPETARTHELKRQIAKNS